MSSDREAQSLQDIIDNVERIESYTQGMDFDAFVADGLVSDAVERCLSPISEAVVRIGVERVGEFAPDEPALAVRGIGNALRYDYGRIDPQIIFTTATERLPSLKAACERALEG